VCSFIGLLIFDHNDIESIFFISTVIFSSVYSLTLLVRGMHAFLSSAVQLRSSVMLINNIYFCIRIILG